MRKIILVALAFLIVPFAIAYEYTIQPESGSTLMAMACEPGLCPDTDSIFNCPTTDICTEAFPSGYETGDQFIFEPGTGSPTINTYGVLTCSSIPCSANLYLWDDSASTWTESVSVGMSAECEGIVAVIVRAVVEDAVEASTCQ